MQARALVLVLARVLALAPARVLVLVLARVLALVLARVLALARVSTLASCALEPRPYRLRIPLPTRRPHRMPRPSMSQPMRRRPSGIGAA